LKAQHVSSGTSLIIRSSKLYLQHLGFVVPCIFKYSIKHPTRCTINLIFIALSRRRRSTCFGHHCAYHQEPPQTAFAAPGFRMIAGVDVFPAVVGLLVPLKHVSGTTVPIIRSPLKLLLHPLVSVGNHTDTRSCKGSLRGLLMIGTVVPETC
jgi:hypothetical protein